jgi:hypothetical protein
MDRLAVLDQGDGYAEMREAVQVVAGAVERVDDPGEAAGTLGAAFLAEDGVIGRGPTQFLDDDRFGLAVDFAGVVQPVLFHDVERVELVHVAQQDVAGGAGGLDHEGDGGFLHGDTGL